MPANQNRVAWLIIVPNLLVFTVFYFFPLALLAYASFSNWDMISLPVFIGIENYVKVFGDELFIKSFLVTVIFVFTSVFVNVLLALGIAILTEKAGSKLASLCRFLVFVPYVVPDAASAGVWNLLFFPYPSSPVNQLLSWFNIGWQGWLGDRNLALPTIILYYIWKNVGFSTLVYVAGLKAIPKAFYDAADVDGADKLTVIRHITVPLLKPITLFIMTTSFISGWQSFTDIYILTRGGPGTATTTLPIYIYYNAFAASFVGRAAVGAIFLFLVTLVLTVVQLRYIRSD
jgi:multiple sugar transport system permease protein/sn-glycerol 3-phosphate transport system permease protein